MIVSECYERLRRGGARLRRMRKNSDEAGCSGLAQFCRPTPIGWPREVDE